jgi:hypothetical protein
MWDVQLVKRIIPLQDSGSSCPHKSLGFLSPFSFSCVYSALTVNLSLHTAAQLDVTGTLSPQVRTPHFSLPSPATNTKHFFEKESSKILKDEQ